jgi:hypothetical protein
VVISLFITCYNDALFMNRINSPIPQKSLTDPRPGWNDLALYTDAAGGSSTHWTILAGRARRRSLPLTMKSAQIDRVTGALDSFRIESPTRVKGKIEAALQTVTMAPELYAKALLADCGELASRQSQPDRPGAELLLQDTFATDVRPAIEWWRTAKGLPRHPLTAFGESGSLERITRERSGRPTFRGLSYA